MPSTFTNTYNLEKPANGEQDGTWGNTVNANMDKIDAALTAETASFAWQRIGTDSNAAGVSLVGFSLPVGYIKYRLEWCSLYTSQPSAGVLISKLSLDNGATFDSSAHYQFGVSVRVFGASENFSTNTSSTYVPLTNGQTGVQIHDGYLDFSVASGHGFLDNVTGGSSTTSQITGSYIYSQPNANGICVSLSNGTFTSGSVRLLGWKPL